MVDNRFHTYKVWGESRAKKTVAYPKTPSKLDGKEGMGEGRSRSNF